MLDSKSVLQISSVPLSVKNTSDVKKWQEIYKILVPHKTIVDRTNSIKMPFDILLWDKFLLPKQNINFNKTFKEICLETANNLLKQDKKILLFYSGGIDSVVILTAFMMLAPKEFLSKKISIVLSPESIAEYSDFYNQHIRSTFPIISSDNISELFNKDQLIVTGGQGDKIFGTDHFGEMHRFNMLDKIHDKLSREFVLNYWKFFKMNDAAANFWFDLIVENSVYDIRTNLDFFWWWNFNFEWQSEYFLFTMRSPSCLSEDFHKSNIFAFYATEDFQQWSMNNPDKKIKDSWKTYKWPAKDFIFEFTKDSNYRDNKIKLPSAGRLFQHKTLPLGIDSNWKYLNDIDIEEIYRNENSFV